MSMFNDIELDRAGNCRCASTILLDVADVSNDFKPGKWCNIWSGSEQSWNHDTGRGTRLPRRCQTSSLSQGI